MFYSKISGFSVKRVEDSQVEITEEEWEALVVGQSEGKVIVQDDKGQPTLAEPPKPTPAEQVAIAETKKRSLLTEANTYTQAWQTQLMLGIISDADKIALTTWMKYYQQVQAVDTSTAPDINWPQKPS